MLAGPSSRMPMRPRIARRQFAVGNGPDTLRKTFPNIKRFCTRGQSLGGGPRNQDEVMSMAPPLNPSARAMVLCDMETPNPKTGGGDSGVGDAANDPVMPDSLQSDDHAYSPSTELLRISNPI